MATLSPLPVNAGKCRTCPFGEGKAAWKHVRPLLEERALKEASPICHSTGPDALTKKGKQPVAHVCRGARDFQLTIFWRLGWIAAPTDAAWQTKVDAMNSRNEETRKTPRTEARKDRLANAKVRLEGMQPSPNRRACPANDRPQASGHATAKQRTGNNHCPSAGRNGNQPNAKRTRKAC